MTMPLSRADFHRGIELFNHGHFFDAHEVLEDVWRSVPCDQPSLQLLRLHVQGVVQLAVAFHHVSTDNRVGACSVLKRAMRNLNGADLSFPDLDLDRLRLDLTPWREYLHHPENSPEGRSVRSAAPALPKIMLRR